LVSGVLVLFYSYGHIYETLRGWRIGGFLVGRHRYLAPLALLILLWWLWWASRRARAVGHLEAFFAVAGIVGLAFPALSIAGSSLGGSASAWDEWRERSGRAYELDPGESTLPDIYYIVVDAYAREDVLRDLYHYDNSEFLGFLRSQGFYVADESRSNYHKTDLSLASSLNMEYLDVLARRMALPPQGDLPLEEMISHSLVREALAGLGYQVVAFDTGVPYTSLEDAEIYLSPGDPTVFPMRLTEFEVLVLRTTALRVVLDGFLRGQTNPAIADLALAEVQRERAILALETLAEIPRWEGSYFVYAHVVIPHPPFVFQSNGEARPLDGEFSLIDGSDFPGSAEQYIEGYVEQLEFLNNRLQSIIPEILAGSDEAPLVILQADHGPRLQTDFGHSEATNMREGMGILNAYYLPEEVGHSLYSSITPVNTFRALFDGFFGANLGLLEDESYFTVDYAPYGFENVTSRAQSE
jgi:hypothetical protein